MIDECSLDSTGWARFSDDRVRRYRLGRVLDPRVRPLWSVSKGFEPTAVFHGTPFDQYAWDVSIEEFRKVVFLLINPSTADAFDPDPTVTNCMKFARRWGAHVLEVVNLYAFRSPYPTDLDALDKDTIGIDDNADQQILFACTGAWRVIAGWGNHGHRHDRGARVRELVRDAGVALMHLGLTKHGNPIHPLARGKMRIPLDREPVAWSPP